RKKKRTKNEKKREKKRKLPPDCCLSESFTSPSCTLGVDLRRGRRRFSGNLQLPPLSWRQGERSRTPDEEVMTRPTSLPFGAPPRIDITPVDPECEPTRTNQTLTVDTRGGVTHGTLICG
uniref:Uncharacterized protein n=1 Tax=Sphaeramia orbicularis TaxID=375764 RepID=A0A673C963_9TELE